MAVGKKILLADDDALVSRIYREKLVEEGFEVAVAEDGVVAMRRLLEFKPDLLVLDLLMPKLTGADVLKFMRQHPELKSTRVIVFSNSFLAALVEQVGSVGVEESLPKSTATPARLIEAIHRVLAEPLIRPRPPETTGKAPLPGAQAETPAAKPPTILTILKRDTPEERAVKDEKFRTRVQDEFMQHLPSVVADIRALCQELIATPDSATEVVPLENLIRKVGFLTQMSTMAGNHQLAQLASALELLLFHLHEKGGPVGDSCRNTIATTVAFVTEKLETLGTIGMAELPPADVLVVDDDAVTNRGLVHSLVHASVHATSETDPQKALERLRQMPYDLILLDVEMPGMDGMQLCEQIRALRLHQHTPVVFVTGHQDLRTRSRAILSGGNDFISKPILPIELTVKVITEVLKGRFAGQDRAK